MNFRLFMLVLLAAMCSPAMAQEEVRLRSAVVVLSDDLVLRQRTEQALAARAQENDYDAVASFTLEPDIEDVDDASFMRILARQGIQAVLMLRPTAVGAGSSLESVRDEVSPEIYERMQEFAGEISATKADELIAVIHLAIYGIDDTGATLLSAGAVWLDEEVGSQDEGIRRLLGLVVENVNAVRPAIRSHLGLPPLR